MQTQLQEHTAQNATQVVVPNSPKFDPDAFSSITLDDGRIIDESSTRTPIWSLVPGKNPRQYFDEEKMRELKDAIAVHGVIQPITVRKNSAGLLEIVAGERRYRAAKELFGEDYEMPITFKVIDDEQSEAYAVIENSHRDSVAATEEATNAGKTLARFKGDYVEAAKYLGWDVKTLKNRIALLQLSATVTTALNTRQIELGVAELLATVTRERQDKALSVILKNKYSISQIRALLQEQAKLMASAIFDKTDCGTCHYNTDLQATMFSENLGTGSCSNSPCYDKKTNDELESRRKSLEDEFPIAKIITVAEKYSIVRIVAEGAKNSVGPEQALACKGCANYGGVVSAMPDTLGTVFRGQCFDVKCNKEKVSAFEKASTPQQVDKSSSTFPKNSKKVSDTPAAGTPKPVVSVVSETQRIKDYRQGIWRTALKKELAQLPQQSLSLLFALAVTANISQVSREKIKEAICILTKSKIQVSTSIFDIAKLTDSLSDQNRNDLLNGLTRSAVDTIEVTPLVEMMTYIDIDLAKHWKINEDFFKLLTKSEIDILSHEIGLKAHLDKTFASLLSKSKDDLIKALLNSGFPFEGVIPKIMLYKK